MAMIIVTPAATRGLPASYYVSSGGHGNSTDPITDSKVSNLWPVSFVPQFGTSNLWQTVC